MHPFEKAGLGLAPFRCVGVYKNAYQACPGAPLQPGGSCDFCGTGIMYEYKILSSDGKGFKVGCDCVMRTGGEGAVAGMRSERLKMERDVRRARRDAKYTERRATHEQGRIAALEARKAEFVRTEPALAAALEALPDSGNEFLVKMRDAVRHWGSLTEGQLRAAKSSIARDASREAEKANSVHVGTVGKRVELKLTIVRHTESYQTCRYTGRAVANHFHVMKAGDNVFVYSGSVNLGAEGATVEAKWTVKDHTEYQGTKQTKLARPAFPKEPEPKAEDVKRAAPYGAGRDLSMTGEC
jgi:hypothetical protein